MAATQNKANIEADLFTVLFDASVAPYHATADVLVDQGRVPVTTARRGGQPIKHLQLGGPIAIEITFQQAKLAEMEVYLDTTLSAQRKLKGPGADPSTFKLTLRPALENDDANSRIFPECVFGTVRESPDGEGERQVIVQVMPQEDDNGDLMWIGPAAP